MGWAGTFVQNPTLRPPYFEYRNHINYERHLQQYIAEYEEFDEKENEIAHFFEKLTININELNSFSDQSNSSIFKSFDELFLISVESLYNVKLMNTIDILVDNVFKHRLTFINETKSIDLISFFNNFIFESRYDDSKFKRFLINSKTITKLIERIKQLNTLQKTKNVQLHTSTIKSITFIFEIESTISIESIILSTLIKSVTFHIVSVNISFLLCLVNMNKLRAFFSNIINQVI
jgi:hypothetical protein